MSWKAEPSCKVCGKRDHREETCPDARVARNGWKAIGPAPEPSARLLALRGARPKVTVTFAKYDERAAEKWPDGPDGQRKEQIDGIKATLAKIDANPHRDPKVGKSKRAPWFYSTSQVEAAADRVAKLLADEDSGVVRLPDSTEESCEERESNVAPVRKAVPIRIKVPVEVLATAERAIDELVRADAATAYVKRMRAERTTQAQASVEVPDIAPPAQSIAERHFGTVATTATATTATTAIRSSVERTAFERSPESHALYLARRERQNAKRKAQSQKVAIAG